MIFIPTSISLEFCQISINTAKMKAELSEIQ